MRRRAALVLAAMTLTLLLASGVALAVTKIGTDGPDTLRGTNGDDQLVGKGGNDILIALAGDDTLLGADGKDVLFGGSRQEPLGGAKNLLGGGGNDFVGGGQGADNLVGGDGNDFLLNGPLGGSSRDNLSGGSGKDVIIATNVPAVRDVVACGGGFDWVLADRKDTVARDCETVKIVRGSREEIIAQEQEFFESIPESFFAGLPQ